MTLPGAGETAYGEDAPRVPDDRLPMVLVLLDGLGDRPQPELDMLTASEAAHTPVLDQLATRGHSGVHIPMGPGRAPSSEVAHWAMFGFSEVPFVGRALLEARGYNVEPPPGSLVLYSALRPSVEHDGKIWITGRTPIAESQVATELLAEMLHQQVGPYTITMHPLEQRGRGECIVTVEGPVGLITDTDPFFEHLHPYAAPLGLAGAPKASAETAQAIQLWLGQLRAHLVAHPVNAERINRGLPALDTVTTKWAGLVEPVPTFMQRVGFPGAMIPTSAFYRGMCRTLQMTEGQLLKSKDQGAQLTAGLHTATELIADGAAFVHVHTKATDLAGHTKDPQQKKAAVEAMDTALAPLLKPPFTNMVVAVTGDHATPSSHGVLHTGDPTPFTITAPWLRPDRVEEFGEGPAQRGDLGHLRAHDVLPLMASYANRPRFLGSRPSPHPTVAVPDDVVPFPTSI